MLVPKCFVNYLYIRWYVAIVDSLTETMATEFDDIYFSKYVILTVLWNAGCFAGVQVPLCMVFWNICAPIVGLERITYIHSLIGTCMYTIIKLVSAMLIVIPVPFTKGKLERFKNLCYSVDNIKSNI